MPPIFSLLFIVLAGAAAQNADPVHAWYRADKGLGLDGDRVTRWKNDAGSGRDLGDIRGHVTAARVGTPAGEARVVRLAGDSMLCASPQAWGVLDADRTLIAYVKLGRDREGFLFDGFTGSGIARARVRRGNWQAGAQPAGGWNNTDRTTLRAETGVWQAHAFVFTHGAAGGGLGVRHYIAGPDGSIRSATVAAGADSPLAGLVIGGNASKQGIHGDLAEFLVLRRAVGGQEFGKIAAVLRQRWGQPENLDAPAGDPADGPAPAENHTPIHAWYRADSGLSLNGNRVRAWKNHVDGGAARDLADIRGNVTAVRVKIPSGEARVVRLDRDSDSALCGSPGAWGSLGGDRTFIVHLKLDGTGDGFLFDGFTWSGIARARARRGKWQAGAQPRGAENFANPDRPTLPAEAGVWQTHAFVFTHPAADDPALAKDNSGLVVRHYIAGPDGSIRSASVAARADSPQAGLVLGGLGERKSLRADLAEFVVVNDAIDETDFGKIAAGLRARWGQPEELGPATAPELISTAVPGLTRTVLRKRGDGGIHTYRIPGLATTPAGTLIAVFDCRNTRAGDLPGDIDVGLMRSTDNGQTWSRMKRILDFPAAAPGAAGNGVGDPSILVDETTGAIFVAALWSHGTRGTAGSGPGLAPEETGQFVLTKSTDDGKTWSRPINITAQVKTPAWTIFFQGPGRGITLRDGALVFPAQYIEAAGAARRFRSCFIYSADHGETWKTSAPAVPGDTSTSESQIAQLADGALLLSMRCEGGAAKGRRLWARYDWTGTLANGTWSAPWSDLPDPTCQASLLAHPAGPLLFANIANPDHRRDLTIRASADGGKTWNTGRLLDPRPSAYSCLTALKDGTVAILYETGEVSPYETLAFARFPLEWITTAP